MASPKQTEKKLSAQSKEMVVNLDSFAVPIAIVVAGIIIALAIFLTNSKADKDANTDPKKNVPTAQDDPANAAGGNVSAPIGDSVYLGDKSKAKIAIIEYSDFQCGHCKTHADKVYPEIKSKYIDTGKVVYVFKTFSLGESGLGYNTALAFHCVADLVDAEKAAAFHKGAFGLASDADVKQLALSLGVNSAKYDTCLTDSKYKAAVTADKDEGRAATISGTPGFVVGKIGEDGKVTGSLIRGAYPMSTFDSTIEALSK